MYSLVTTTFDDIDGLKVLINSLKHFQKKPNEIVIIDSCSQDGTEDYIKELNRIDINYVRKKTTIGQARNLGVQLSKNDIILITDTYCVPSPFWSQAIIRDLEKGYDFVATNYGVIGGSDAQIGYGSLVNQKKIKKSFNPSSRSIGFLKKSFIDLGMYPTEFNEGEDTEFNRLIISKGFRHKLIFENLVSWYSRKTFKELRQQYKRYTLGDLKYGIFKKRFLFSILTNVFLNVIFLGLPMIVYVLIITFFLFNKKNLNYLSFKARYNIDKGTSDAIQQSLIGKIKSL